MKLTNQVHVPDEFDELNAMMQQHLSNLSGPWFVAQVDLTEAYLANVPDRQWHDCRCCKSFIYKYGDMYTYVDGVPMTLWSFPGMPEKYARLCMRLDNLVMENIKPDDPLHTFDRKMGTEYTGQFTHFNLLAPKEQLRQTAIHYREACERMTNALKNGFTERNLQQIRDNAMVMNWPRLDKLYPQLDFMLSYVKKGEVDRRIMLAQAYDGNTHPQASVLGMCVTALVSGKSWSEITELYTKATDPFNYQRPTAPPRSGAIQHAEKLFEQMGLVRSLERRPIQVQDVPQNAYLWKTNGKAVFGSLFGHLKPKTHTEPTTQRTMTWAKFKKTVLPQAVELWWVVQSMATATLTTALHPDAPPILRWDREDHRNPVAWWLPGTPWDWTRMQTHLRLIPVRAVLSGVPTWSGDMTTLPHDLVWLMHGPTPNHNYREYTGLFPEVLRPELHPVRSVIEAYNANTNFRSSAQDVAQAIRVDTGAKLTPFSLQVKTTTLEFRVLIDRPD